MRSLQHSNMNGFPSTYIYPLTYTHTHWATHTDLHAHTLTYTHWATHTVLHTVTYSLAFTHWPTRTHTDIHTVTYTHWHAHTQTYTLLHTPILNDVRTQHYTGILTSQKSISVPGNNYVVIVRTVPAILFKIIKIAALLLQLNCWFLNSDICMQINWGLEL